MEDPSIQPRRAMPARPSTASSIRSPLDRLPVPAPRSVIASLWIWIISCLVPLVAIIYSVTRLDDVRAHLRATAMIEDPSATAESLDRVVNVTMWIALAALAVPVVVEIILAIVMANRRNWARVLLLLAGLLGIPAAAIAFGALSDDAAASKNNLAIGIAVQALLVVVAIVLMFVPSANHWFRTSRRAR
jgi:hypothetical protein